MLTLPERLLAIHRTLDAAAIPHAFGGAIALAYWTLEPRGTRDIDVNVFVRANESERVLAGLPDGITITTANRHAISRDEQVRLWWDETPVDLFFNYAAIHSDAARNTSVVPFQGSEIPILGPVELGVFKAMFARTKDWADIEAMFTAGAVGEEEIRRSLLPMLDARDHRLSRLAEAARRAGSPDG